MVRALLILSVLLPTAVFAASPQAPTRNKWKLKPGAQGKLCLDCHTDFENVLKKASVHTPVKAADCAGCHNPHTSEHGKLLAATGNAVCAACHADIVPKDPKNAHKPVADGCSNCHNPHASNFPANLVKAPQELCTNCHKELGAAITKAKFKHRPLEKGGCGACHDPHGDASATLLKKRPPDLCLDCHKTGSPVFAKKHLGYPVAKARCTSCHDPHASSQAGLLWDNVHPPVAKGACAQCHNPATAPKPLEVKTEGIGLCRSCHSDRITAMLEKNRLHRAVIAGDACLGCHTPHASRRPKLVQSNLVAACGSCHADTIRRQANTPSKHPPMLKGECSACHAPHSSDTPLMLVNNDLGALCGKCHNWQQHSSHPLGEKLKDPRNANLGMNCLSCHRAHGTEYKHMSPYPETTALCTKCHEKFRR